MLVNHSQCFTAVKYDYVNQNGSKRRFYLIEDWKYLRLGRISFVKHRTEPVFVLQLIQMKQEDKNVGTKIICALLEAKADLYIKNKEGRTPLDLMEDETIKHFMIM